MQLDAARAGCLKVIDDDAAAYQALQNSWRDDSLSSEERHSVESAAAQVPFELLAQCAQWIEAVRDFLPRVIPIFVPMHWLLSTCSQVLGRAAWCTRCCSPLSPVNKSWRRFLTRWTKQNLTCLHVIS